nr:MAG TPA: hypothetical protein [Caudoviricetes sp.]
MQEMQDSSRKLITYLMNLLNLSVITLIFGI